MSLSTTPAEVLLQLAAGLTQLQQVSLCYGEMADAAAAATGWSALPLRSLVSRAVQYGYSQRVSSAVRSTGAYLL
jgi:hypothetical protein